MNGILVATTATEGLQPLGSAALRSWELVSGALAARLGADHAALFAEPVPSEHGDSIDWYVAGPGTVVPLAALAPDEAQALRARLGEMAAAIRAEAEALRHGRAAAEQRLGEALLNALEIPGEDMIHARRSPDGRLHPVLVHWAWTRGERAVARGVLSRMEPRPAAREPGEAAPATARGGLPRWLPVAGWLLLALMLGAILYLLIAPCGLNPAGPRFCPGDAPALAAAYSETAALADAVAALEREIARADRACRPVIPAAAPAAAPPAPPAAPGAGNGGGTE